MRTALIAVLTAALVTVALLWLWPAPPPPSDPTARLDDLSQRLAEYEARAVQRPIDLVVVLTQRGAQCMSQTSPHGYAYPQQPVRWWIINANCNLNGREIELRFSEENTPLDTKRPRHARFIITRVRGDAAVGLYKYALWAVGKAGDYQLEDPELEIGDF